MPSQLCHAVSHLCPSAVTACSLPPHCLPKQDLTWDDHRLQQAERKAPRSLQGAQAGHWCFSTRLSRCPPGSWGQERCLWQELPLSAHPCSCHTRPGQQHQSFRGSFLQVQLSCDSGNAVISTVNWEEKEEKLSVSDLNSKLARSGKEHQ